MMTLDIAQLDTQLVSAILDILNRIDIQKHVWDKLRLLVSCGPHHEGVHLFLRSEYLREHAAAILTRCLCILLVML